jgi:hypothetical protein
VSRRAVQPLALAGAAALSAIGVALLGPGPLRGTLGIALVLLLTGAAWTTLLGPTVPLADRILAVLASSIATTILVGIGLGATRLGFRAGDWALALGLVAVAAAMAALLTGGPSASEEHPRYERLAQRLRRAAPTLACFAVALAIAVLAVVLAHHSAERNGQRADQIANLVTKGGDR